MVTFIQCVVVLDSFFSVMDTIEERIQAQLLTLAFWPSTKSGTDQNCSVSTRLYVKE